MCSQRISVKSIPPDRLASSAEPNPAFAEVSRETERMCPKTKKGTAPLWLPYLFCRFYRLPLLQTEMRPMRFLQILEKGGQSLCFQGFAPPFPLAGYILRSNANFAFVSFFRPKRCVLCRNALCSDNPLGMRETPCASLSPQWESSAFPPSPPAYSCC